MIRRGMWLGRLAPLALVAAMALPAPATAASPLGGLPTYDHVVVLVEENESFSATFAANSPAVYLNKTLVPQGVLADQYYGTGHVSLDNYIAMVSGQRATPFTATDCSGINFYTCVHNQDAQGSARSLGDQLVQNGISWKGYMDGYPANTGCFHADYSPTATGSDPYQGAGNDPTPAGPNYADRHNPFIYFAPFIGPTGASAACVAHVRPYQELGADLQANTLGRFSFITPDTCHDGHDPVCLPGNAPGGLASMDGWLKTNMPPLLSYLAGHNGLLLLTFDEAATSSTGDHATPTNLPGGGRVGLVALGPGVKVGTVVHTAYDHFSLLRTIEDELGISEHLNNAAGAADMTDLFGAAAATSSSSPTASSSAGAPSGGGGLPPTSRGLGLEGPTGVFLATLAGLGLLARRRGRQALSKRRRSG